MQGEPGERRDVVPADGVDMEVEGVDFEVEGVEGEGLHEAEDGFAEEGVQADVGGGLIQERDDRVAEDEGDERAGPIDAVFDVLGGEELEGFVPPGSAARVEFGKQAYEHEYRSMENVEGECDPERDLGAGLIDVDAANPDD